MSLRARLRELTKEELLDVIDRLVAQDPSLEAVATVPPAGRRAKLNAGDIERRAREIVLAIGDDWRGSSSASRKLAALVEVGHGYEDAGDTESAWRVYAAITRGIVQHFEAFRDEDGLVADTVFDCSLGLGRLLAAAREAVARAPILEELFWLLEREHVETGGYGLTTVALGQLKKHADEDERRALAARLRAALAASPDAHERYRAQAVGRTVLELLPEASANEQHQLLREHQLYTALAERLLASGDVAAAVELLESAPESDTIALTELLDEAGAGDRALEIVRARAPTIALTQGYSGRRFLEKHGVPYDERLEKIDTLLSRASSKPRVRDLEELLELGRATGTERYVLERVLARLDQTPDAKALLYVRARVLAAMGDLDGAVRVLGALRESEWKTAALAVFHEAAARGRREIAEELFTKLSAQLSKKKSRAARRQLEELKAKAKEQ